MASQASTIQPRRDSGVASGCWARRKAASVTVAYRIDDKPKFEQSLEIVKDGKPIALGETNGQTGISPTLRAYAEVINKKAAAEAKELMDDPACDAEMKALAKEEYDAAAAKQQQTQQLLQEMNQGAMVAKNIGDAGTALSGMPGRTSATAMPG